MTTPDQTDASDSGGGAWGAVARLLSLQLLTVIAVTAIITGIYALTGPHNDRQATAGGSSPESTRSIAPTTKPPTSSPQASPPASASASPTASASASPPASASAPASQPPSEAASRLKVDVLNQSGGKGTAAATARRLRAIGWTIGRVDNFNGNVTTTTVYYPNGEAKAARQLAGALPGNPRVLPRFNTLADHRLTVLLTR